MENRLKILLLEDDPEDVEIIQHILQENIPGFDYHFAANKNALPKCIIGDTSRLHPGR
jgi:CheY-like chemotaxis protein